MQQERLIGYDPNKVMTDEQLEDRLEGQVLYRLEDL
jgi:hypothetical protein